MNAGDNDAESKDGKVWCSWKSPPQEEQPWITGFEVTWTLSSHEFWDRRLVDKNTNRVGLDGLSGGLEYRIRVCSTTRAGKGPYSETLVRTKSS